MPYLLVVPEIVATSAGTSANIGAALSAADAAAVIPTTGIPAGDR